MTESITIILSACAVVLSVVLVHIRSRKERTEFETRIMKQHHNTALQLQKLRLAVQLIANQLGIKLPNGEETA